MADQQRKPVGVRLKEAGKVYYFDARDLELDVSYYVVVETTHGQEVGRVVIAPDQVIASEIKESLKPIIRRAEPEDLERSEEQKKAAAAHVQTARQHAEDEGAKMWVVGASYSLDGSQLTFYYTADDRVDFRGLARTLSSRLDVRVQFLQIGDRDRAKMADGIGRCGERLCCSSWLGTFPTVSIKMAKEQDLPLNPSKLSGACGRLLCCLTYEYDQYREIKGGLPKVGAKISTPTGEARVLRINVPKETISLAIGEPVQQVEMPLTQFQLMYGTAIRPIELTDTFEKDLMAADVAEAEKPAAEQRPPRPAAGQRPPAGQRPAGAGQRPAAGQRPPGAPQQPQQERPGQQDQPARRRRRRRGGRGRRRGGQS